MSAQNMSAQAHRTYSTRQYSTRQRSTRRRSTRRRRTCRHSTLRPSRSAHHAQPITLSHHAQPITLSPSVSITGRPSASAQQGSRPGTRVGPAYRPGSRRPTPAPRLDPAPIGVAPLKPSSPQARRSRRAVSIQLENLHYVFEKTHTTGARQTMTLFRGRGCSFIW